MAIPTFNPGDVLTAEVMNEIKNSLLPTASVLPYAGSTAPTGFLLCDGSAVSRTTYDVLFSILGTTYGAGDSSTTFNLPDLRGRTPVGSGNDGTAANNQTRTLGTKSGDTRLQSHTHTGTTGTMNSNWSHIHEVVGPGGHSHGVNFGGLSGQATFTFSPAAIWAGTYAGRNEYADYTDINHTHSFTTADHNQGIGSGANMQPFTVLNYIIRA